MPPDVAKAATPWRKSISRRRGGLAETLVEKTGGWKIQESVLLDTARL
jgi:hypothetical protein